MTWGIGPWGGEQQWGGAGLFDPPVIVSVDTEFDDLFETRGGTIGRICGLNFVPEFIPQVLAGSAGGPYIVVAEGYLFDPRFDITEKGSEAFAGFPAVAPAVYHLRVKTPGGLSNVLESVLDYRVFPEEGKIQKASATYASVWATPRKIGA